MSYPMDFPVRRETRLFVRYGDGYDRALKGHVDKNRRRVFVAGRYVGTERNMGIKGGHYSSYAHAYNSGLIDVGLWVEWAKKEMSK